MAKTDAEIIARANKILADAIEEQTRALKYTNSLLHKLLVENKTSREILEEAKKEPPPDDVVRERVRSVADSLKRVADSFDNVHTIDGKSEGSTDA